MKKDINYYLNLPYNIIIKRDPYGGYFAKILELKGCMTQGETIEEATEMIQDAMKLWLEVAIERKIKIPEPETESHSGKFVLRIPKSLHKRLVEIAKMEKISLNQYLLNLISERNIYKELINQLIANVQYTHFIKEMVHQCSIEDDRKQFKNDNKIIDIKEGRKLYDKFEASGAF